MRCVFRSIRDLCLQAPLSKQASASFPCIVRVLLLFLSSLLSAVWLSTPNVGMNTHVHDAHTYSTHTLHMHRQHLFAYMYLSRVRIPCAPATGVTMTQVPVEFLAEGCSGTLDVRLRTATHLVVVWVAASKGSFCDLPCPTATGFRVRGPGWLGYHPGRPGALR